MPSPFPGMDPYLEHPARWPSVHHGLISSIQDLLGAAVEPRYYVSVEERVYISGDDDAGRQMMVPDARLMPTSLHHGRHLMEQGSAALISDGIELELMDTEIHEAYLELTDAEYHNVVAVIEVVSPTNKVWGAEGRKSFAKKRVEVEASSAHFLEIDLLRGGTPLFAKEMLPEHDYLVRLSRVQRRPAAKYWPIRLNQRLPVIPVPLKAGDDDATLDLQKVLDESYRRGRYHLRIDYSKEPVPPVTGPSADWVRATARSAAAAV